MKRLYRSQKDKLVAGVIGGIGEYFEVDPTILRLGFIVLLLLTGIFPAIIAYAVAYFIIPDQPQDGVPPKNNPRTNTPPSKTTTDGSLDTSEDTLTRAKKEPETKTSTADVPGLRKPNWPTIARPTKENNTGKIEYPEDEPTTATL